ncbi:pectin methylesterase [Paenibacillus sp. FSL H8-0548]|uniref:pectinesterase family protein n=1 Tax=Paenibacillus sp. FSL H8-0548 TaxID=1920422 RepID=UPI00096E70D8|nr:pectinesterase family protein [Paenibacillus sp. FSL H8-0548]OMF22694.1 pectin methylesterase [Paenibacillus sp. FSL H8-0548]
MIVAKDGSGDFTTVQEAVNAVPPNSAEQVIITIKNGIYKEKLHIEKPMITLLGESAEHTIITYDDYALKAFPDGELYHTFHSYTLFVGDDDFSAEQISFVNSAGKGEEVGQALAAYVDGDRAMFRKCRFIGWQDTLFTGPLPPYPVDRSTFGGPREGLPRKNVRQYYEDCYIEGDVDYIFGSATAVFNRCEIFTKNRLEGQSGVNGWITAASTPVELAFGYVFLHCRLTSNAPAQTVYLGRPWREHAKAAFIQCWLGEHIIAEGWHNWNKPASEQTTFFSEYSSSGPGAHSSGRASWSHMLNDEEAGVFNMVHILAGEDGWTPVS